LKQFVMHDMLHTDFFPAIRLLLVFQRAGLPRESCFVKAALASRMTRKTASNRIRASGNTNTGIRRGVELSDFSSWPGTTQ